MSVRGQKKVILMCTRDISGEQMTDADRVS